MSRSIALGLVAVVAAFALSFGVGKAAGGKTATAGVKAAAIKVAGAPAVQSVELGGTVPALKSTPKKKTAKKKKAPSSNNDSTPAPSSNDSSPAPNTSPSTPTTPKVTPKDTPKPPVTGPAGPGDGEAPVTGGNEDG
jgi:hypothetical protein